MRLGSADDPLMWYISQPAKCGPLTSHFSRLPSDVSMNAPLRVPTSTRTLLIYSPFQSQFLLHQFFFPSFSMDDRLHGRHAVTFSAPLRIKAWEKGNRVPLPPASPYFRENMFAI